MQDRVSSKKLINYFSKGPLRILPVFYPYKYVEAKIRSNWYCITL